LKENLDKEGEKLYEIVMDAVLQDSLKRLNEKRRR
jgi:hypothetical protein